jgi:CspA family cold shock protein
MDVTMVNGVVKWFNDQKGFGFVSASGKDYFIHFKEINMQGFKSLKEGDKVSFEPSQSPKGPVATQLVVVQD